MKKSINQGEIGMNIVPVTTKEFKKIVRSYFRTSKVKVYKFVAFNQMHMYIDIFFWGKLTPSIAEELRSYVAAGCDFLFLKQKWWQWIYSTEYGLFWRKKLKLSERDCKNKREKVVAEIEDERKENIKQKGEGTVEETETSAN